METKAIHRKFLAITLCAVTILAFALITGCSDDDDDGMVGPTVGAEVIWTVEDGGVGKTILNAVFFLDNSTGWAVGSNGTMIGYSAADGWSPIATGVDFSLRGVHFTDKSTGYVVGENGFFMTTVDGGATWNVDSTHIECLGNRERIRNRFNDIFFATPSHGYAVADNGFVYSFTVDSNCLDTTVLGTLIFIDSIRLDTLVVDSVFYDSAHIDSVPYFPDSIAIDTVIHQVLDSLILAEDTVQVLDTLFDDTATVVSQTQSGMFILRDETSGIEITFIQDLFDVQFIDPLNGWIVGGYGTILHTGNAGQSWEVQSSGTQSPLRSVCFADPMTGWAVGQNGLILHTSNGGDSWHAQFENSGVTDHFVAVDFPDRLNGWVVSTKGEIYRTADGGTSWTRDRRGSENSLNAASFVDATTGWVVGFDGQIIHAQPAE